MRILFLAFSMSKYGLPEDSTGALSYCAAWGCTIVLGRPKDTSELNHMAETVRINGFARNRAKYFSISRGLLDWVTWDGGFMSPQSLLESKSIYSPFNLLQMSVSIFSRGR